MRDNAELNSLNQRLHDQLNLNPDTFLTQTILHGSSESVFCIRFAIGSRQTAWDDVSLVWKMVQAEGEAILERDIASDYQ